MKNRILFALTLFFALSFASTNVQAQDSELEKITAALGLNANQVKKWKMVDRSFDSRIAKVVDSDVSNKEKASKVRKLQQEKDKKIQMFTSKAQWEKLLEYRASKDED